MLNGFPGWSRAIRVGRRSAQDVRVLASTANRQGVIYVGWLGYRNVGDEWMRRLFEANFGRVDVAAESLGALRLQLRSHPSRVRPTVLLGGGTLLGTDHVGRQLAVLAEEWPNARFVAVGTGLEDGRLSDEWRARLSTFESVTVRGVLSAERLAEAGLVGVQVLGDPGFLLSPVEGSPSDRLLVNVSEVLRRFGPGAYQRFCDETVRAARCFAEIRILVLSPEDLAISSDLLGKLGGGAKLVRVYRELQPSAETFFGKAAFGVRLHFGVFCAAAGTPVRVVGYHPKALDLQSTLTTPLVLPSEPKAWQFRELIPEMEAASRQTCAAVGSIRDTLKNKVPTLLRGT